MVALTWLRLRGDHGASLVEYGLLLALIAMACLLALEFFGNSTGSQFSRSGSLIG